MSKYKRRVSRAQQCDGDAQQALSCANEVLCADAVSDHIQNVNIQLEDARRRGAKGKLRELPLRVQVKRLLMVQLLQGAEVR